jgi:hypothetical protein
MFSDFFSENRAVCGNGETYGGAKEATNDNTWRMRVACWISKSTPAQAHGHTDTPEPLH